MPASPSRPLSTLGAGFTAVVLVLGCCTSCTERPTAPTPGSPPPAPTTTPEATKPAAKSAAAEPAAKPAAAEPAAKPAEKIATKPAGSATGAIAGWPSPLSDPTAAKAWAEIQAVYNTIPTTFDKYPGDLNELAKRVADDAHRLETFISMYPGTGQACQGRIMLGKLRFYLRQRHRQDLTRVRKLPAPQVERSMIEYNYSIVRLATDALACLPGEKTSWHADAHKLAADSEYFSKRFESALRHYRKILEDHPGFPNRDNVLSGAGNCLLELDRFEEGIKFVRKAIEENPDSGYLPFYYQLLWKLYLRAGDIMNMIAICDEIETVGRQRLAVQGIDARERQAWIRYRGFGAFRKGYSILADGRPGDALHSLEQGLALMDQIESKLKAEGKGFPPELNVYRQRIHTVITYISERHGEVPAMDLSTIHWATGNRVVLRENLGKTILIVFRAYGDRRQHEFLRALDAHVAKHPDKLRMVTLSYMQGTTRTVEEQAQIALAEAMDLGLRACAVGMDPSPRSDVIRGFGSTVGSGNIVIIGPDGRDQFFAQDPRDIDSNLFSRVLDRIAQVKP